MSVSFVISLVATLGGGATIVYLLRVARRGDPERAEEAAARAHFDRYGRWPDDEPGAG